MFPKFNIVFPAHLEVPPLPHPLHWAYDHDCQDDDEGDAGGVRSTAHQAEEAGLGRKQPKKQNNLQWTKNVQKAVDNNTFLTFAILLYWYCLLLYCDVMLKPYFSLQIGNQYAEFILLKLTSLRTRSAPVWWRSSPGPWRAPAGWRRRAGWSWRRGARRGRGRGSWLNESEKHNIGSKGYDIPIQTGHYTMGHDIVQIHAWKFYWTFTNMLVEKYRMRNHFAF